MAPFDLDQTRALVDLFAIPHARRDPFWRRRFYAAAPDATLQSFEPQVEQGPDGFPYFQMGVPGRGPVTPFCITHVLDHCLEKGFGAVVFETAGREGSPGWVFTYGELLSFKLFGRFDGEPGEAGMGSGSIPVTEAREVLVGAPSEACLPGFARRVIGAFCRNTLRHPDPRVALVADHSLTPSRNLMINVSRELYGGDDQKLSTAFHYLSWFMPKTYALLALPTGWSTESFVPLE